MLKLTVKILFTKGKKLMQYKQANIFPFLIDESKKILNKN
jgi:hypothetical protein